MPQVPCKSIQSMNCPRTAIVPYYIWGPCGGWVDLLRRCMRASGHLHHMRPLHSTMIPITHTPIKHGDKLCAALAENSLCVCVCSYNLGALLALSALGIAGLLQAVTLSGHSVQNQLRGNVDS